MLPFALIAIVLHQASPSVVFPGNEYREGDLPAPLGAPAVELCEASLKPTTLRGHSIRGGEAVRIAPSECAAPFLLLGAALPSQTVTPAGLAQDRRSGDVLITLGTQTSRLRRTPYSDGGIRAVLLAPDGAPAPLFESATPGASVDLVWAGDLDADGNLDLVLEASEGLYGYALLVLSSAKGDALAPPSATLERSS